MKSAGEVATLILFTYILVSIPLNSTFNVAAFVMNSTHSESPSSISIEFMTYLGGDGEDWLADVCFDSQGNVWVLGYTESVDLPLVQAIQESYGGAGDAIIAKFSSQYGLEFCTYFGGDGVDYAMAVEIDNNGDIVVVGHTESSDFPVLNEIQSNLNGTSDAFISKFAPNGSLLFSTYFGGSGTENVEALCFDSAGNYILAGATGSTDLPVTEGVIQNTYGGGLTDAMLVSFASDGQSIGFCSFFGGNGDDYAIGMVLDTVGNIHITGIVSDNDTVSVNAFQKEYGGGLSDAFVAKLNSNCDSLIWCSLLGGNGWEFAGKINLDSEGSIIISGYTGSTDFPLMNELMGNKGGNDAFLCKLTDNGTNILFSSYIGGGMEDRSYGLGVFPDDSVVLLCQAHSADFPVTNPLQAENKGSVDGYLLILNANDEMVFGSYFGGSLGDYPVGLDVMGNSTVVFTGYSSSSDLPLVKPTQSIKAEDTDGFLCIIIRTDTSTIADSMILIIIGMVVVAAIVAVIAVIQRRK